jgi:hypothetical protein
MVVAMYTTPEATAQDTSSSWNLALPVKLLLNRMLLLLVLAVLLLPLLLLVPLI